MRDVSDVLAGKREREKRVHSGVLVGAKINKGKGTATTASKANSKPRPSRATPVKPVNSQSSAAAAAPSVPAAHPLSPPGPIGLALTPATLPALGSKHGGTQPTPFSMEVGGSAIHMANR